MTGRKTAGIVLCMLGIIILVLSLAADPIGLGNPAQFGYKQIIGTIVGAIASVVGLILALRK